MILVSGGTGAIGSRLVAGLVAAGHRVRVLTLPNDPTVNRVADLGVEIAYADIADPASLEGHFAGVHTVYHLAAVLLANDPAVFERVNVQGTANMVRAALAAGVGHFVLVSSASVFYPLATPYSISKQRKEQTLRELTAGTPMQWTIVRPTLAYSAIGGEEFLMFLSYLKRYPVVPFIGAGNARKRPVHTDDLMQGLLAIAGNPKTHGKAYNLSGGQTVTIRELAHLMLASQGTTKPFVSVPVWLCRLLSWLGARLLRRPPITWSTIAGVIQDADLDNSEARADLGFCPIGVSEGLARCFKPPALKPPASTNLLSP